jgi:hypothetical protein
MKNVQNTKLQVVKKLLGKPRCPKCNAELYHLQHYESGENHYHFSLNDDGTKHYETEEFQGNGEVTDYECPYCSEVLTTNEDKAREILGGVKNG